MCKVYNLAWIKLVSDLYAVIRKSYYLKSYILLTQSWKTLGRHYFAKSQSTIDQVFLSKLLHPYNRTRFELWWPDTLVNFNRYNKYSWQLLVSSWLSIAFTLPSFFLYQWDESDTVQSWATSTHDASFPNLIINFYWLYTVVYYRAVNVIRQVQVEF